MSQKPSGSAHRLHATSGRGLFLIENLVREWGVRPLADEAGKVVFAVLEPVA
ncbi:ATP-binding protein [Actinomadura macrotermitis]|uniref:ATP-binding protein n=1 Tax=Actinomadura macrotermitis TaxID=2585200 RepID=A0A7K0BUS2_9ACTN|nr:hypothetical protein [Actinomadura macrotermitis]MQY04806.1 hypothetical protein [Actinomadura macrotermitis]